MLKNDIENKFMSLLLCLFEKKIQSVNKTLGIFQNAKRLIRVELG